MQGSTIKTLAAILLALLVVTGLGAFFWPTASQQIPTFRATPTRITQGANPTSTISPSPTPLGNRGNTPIPTATPMTTASATKVETVIATVVMTATSNEPKASETPTPPNNGSIVHTVKAGDNMFRLSVNYGVSLSALAAANRLRTDAVLKVGQTLVIPSTATATPAKTTPTLNTTLVPTATKSANITSTLIPISQVNGLPIASFIVLPTAVKTNIRQIYAKGQAAGNNATVFSKVGDSTIEPPHFLDRFDGGPYVLGSYAYLQPAITYYAGSFARPSLAVKRGLSGWGLFDVLWADREKCLSDEGPLACELRLNKPSVVFIRIGSNDGSDPATFDKMMRKAVEYCIEQGVIPIIGTKADRFQDLDGGRNRVLRQIAAEYALPLWDFDLVAQTIPGRGLENDNVHLTTYWLHDYSLSGALYRGHGAHSITALIALDQVWKTLSEK